MIAFSKVDKTAWNNGGDPPVHAVEWTQRDRRGRETQTGRWRTPCGIRVEDGDDWAVRDWDIEPTCGNCSALQPEMGDALQQARGQ